MRAGVAPNPCAPVPFPPGQKRKSPRREKESRRVLTDGRSQEGVDLGLRLGRRIARPGPAADHNLFPHLLAQLFGQFLERRLVEAPITGLQIGFPLPSR